LQTHKDLTTQLDSGPGAAWQVRWSGAAWQAGRISPEATRERERERERDLVEWCANMHQRYKLSTDYNLFVFEG